MASTLESLSHQLTSRGVKVHVGQLPTLTADRTALEQVFGNLINNAVTIWIPRAREWTSARAHPRRLLCQVAIMGAVSAPKTCPWSSYPSAAQNLRRGRRRAGSWPWCRPSSAVTAGASGWKSTPDKGHHLLHQHPGPLVTPFGVDDERKSYNPCLAIEDDLGLSPSSAPPGTRRL
jgi:hypothetical protein